MPPAIAERKPKTNKEEPKAKEFQFRLLRGMYVEGRGANQVVYKVEVDPVTKENICPIISTDKNLLKFNGEGVAPKFELVTGVQTAVLLDPTQRMQGESLQAFMMRLSELQNSVKNQVAEQLKEIESYDKEELEDFAESEEIDVKGAKTLEALRMAVKNHLKG